MMLHKLSEAETQLKYYTFKSFAIKVRNIFFKYLLLVIRI